MGPTHLGAAELRSRNTVTDVTRERQPKPAAHRIAVDRGDDRFVHLQRARIGVGPRAGPWSFHLALGKSEIFFQVAADAKGVPAAGEDDRPYVFISLGFLPRFIERPVEIPADGVLFLGTIQANNGDVRIALLVNT